MLLNGNFLLRRLWLGEGELKKRIRQLIKELTKDDEHYFAADDIVNIVFDEAKKELIEIIYSFHIITTDKKKRLIAIDKEAFEKWFGKIMELPFYLDNLKIGDSSLKFGDST